MIIEIISPGSVTEDRVHKFTEYEQARVCEYWVIDPRPHQEHAEFFILGEDNIYHPAPLDDKGIYHATILPHFWVDLDWLWSKKLPNPQLVLAEIMLANKELPSGAKEVYRALYKLLTGKR